MNTWRRATRSSREAPAPGSTSGPENSRETPKLDFWRFKDGKAIEFYEYFDTACVVAAAT
ncbi:ketosteroid isomerase-like protein [Bradyrhizobium diazoefficiens]